MSNFGRQISVMQEAANAAALSLKKRFGRTIAGLALTGHDTEWALAAQMRKAADLCDRLSLELWTRYRWREERKENLVKYRNGLIVSTETGNQKRTHCCTCAKPLEPGEGTVFHFEGYKASLCILCDPRHSHCLRCDGILVGGICHDCGQSHEFLVPDLDNIRHVFCS